jgi:hypothetical protein
LPSLRKPYAGIAERAARKEKPVGWAASMARVLHERVGKEKKPFCTKSIIFLRPLPQTGGGLFFLCTIIANNKPKKYTYGNE